MRKRLYVVKLWVLPPFKRPVWAVFVRGARKPIIFSTTSCGDVMDALARKLARSAKKRRRDPVVTVSHFRDQGRINPRGFDH